MEKSCLDDLRERFRVRRKHSDMSLDQIAAAVGFRANVLHRFFHGGKINADHALRLGRWLGMTDSETFGRAAAEEGDLRGGEALLEIKRLIRADESLPEERREILCEWFEKTYRIFSGCGDGVQ